MSGEPSPGDDTYNAHLEKTLAELQAVYHNNVAPVEKMYDYDVFRPSWFAETIVQKKPFVTFLGPFSAGKSTFINYLLQGNYLQTGPQPVTDKFTVIMHGDQVQQVPGRVLVADPSHPFRGLSQFGDSFVECFNGLLAPHPILRSVNLIDTPGVLEAAGDIHQRRYDYVKVCRWFIERSDLVFFMFDPSKLDAGLELRMLFKHALRGFENRTRIVLNKADSVGPQELMRVYGSLFWNLSNLINTTEPPRVYVSSFWDQPYQAGTDHQLFSDEKSDLLYDLTEVVPIQSLDKRVTSVLRRAQHVYTHALVCATLRQAMPLLIGKEKAKKSELAKLPETVKVLSQKYRIAENDFGTQADYVAFLEKVNLFDMADMDKCTKKGVLDKLKKMMDVTLPGLLKPIQSTHVVDPGDRKHAIMLQRQYQEKLAEQAAGQSGIQGGLGAMQTPTHIAPLAVAVPGAHPVAGQAMTAEQMQLQMQMMQMQMQMMQMAAAAGGQPPTPVPSASASATPPAPPQ